MPTVLDLFAGEGGTAMGYARSGLTPIGIDNDPRMLARYHFECYQMDWRQGIEKFAGQADLIHASPPCQHYSRGVLAPYRDRHPDLVASVREMLIETGKPYVIENVPGAPLINPVSLSGCMFNLTAEYRGTVLEAQR